MKFIEACEKFISLDSTPTAGNWEIAQYAADLCRDAGFAVTLQEEQDKGLPQANVIVKCTEDQQGGLMLQSHLDTVEPAHYSLWTKTGANPFEPTIYDDRIYGLGSADVKLDFLCKLEALKRVDMSRIRRPLSLVGTFGEETGMHGITRLMRKRIIQPKWALVGEATSLELVRAGKGIALIEVDIPFSRAERSARVRHNEIESSTGQSKIYSGRPGHSSILSSGENAIEKFLENIEEISIDATLLELEGGHNFTTIAESAFVEYDTSLQVESSMISKLRALKQAIRILRTDFMEYSQPDFDFSVPTLNLGRVKTTDDFVRFKACLRLPPQVEEEMYNHWLQHFKFECEKVGAEFRVVDFKKPFVTRAESEFVALVQSCSAALGLSDRLNLKSVTNEANVLHRFGVECLAFGAGVLEGNAHTPHENVKISDLQKAIEFYQAVITRMCL